MRRNAVGFRGDRPGYGRGQGTDTIRGIVGRVAGIHHGESDAGTAKLADVGAARLTAGRGGLKDCRVCGVKGLSSYREPHLAPCGGACAGFRWTAPRSAYFAAPIVGKTPLRVIHRLVLCERCGPLPVPADPDPALLVEQKRQWKNWVIAKLSKGESAF
jgi:hypothetical protein